MGDKLMRNDTGQAIVTLLREFLNTQQSALESKIGTLSSLTTTAKASLVAAINELVANRGALNGLSTTAKSTIVAAINELVGVDSGHNTRISSLEDRVGRNNAGAHNSIYRGKNLGAFTEAQSAAIRAGTFADIYCGDCWVFSNIPYKYLDENDEEKSSTYSGTMRAADLDYYLKTGDQGDGIIVHHVVVVPDTNMFTAPMNAENKTEGGYVGSKMRTVYLRRAEAIFKACFGENHVLKHCEYLVNAVKDGRASAGATCDSFVDLMDERMVYGAPQFDSSAPDGSGNVGTTFHRYGVSCKQLNLFRHRPDLISNRQWYWLRNVVSAAFFAAVSYYGDCSFSHASSSGSGVRPAALIY